MRAGSAPAFELYGLELEHKHMPEIQLYSGLTARPIFRPRSAISARGCWSACRCISTRCRASRKAADLSAVFKKHYRGQKHFHVMESDDVARIEPESLNGTNDIEIHVFANEARRQAVLVAKFDNLGKGASGAAVQNLMLMLGR